MKRLFSALLATVFAFSSFTLSASALESKMLILQPLLNINMFPLTLIKTLLDLLMM